MKALAVFRMIIKARNYFFSTRYFYLIIVTLLMINCGELLHRECRVTGDYKVYDLPNGYLEITDIIDTTIYLNFFDSCSISIDDKGFGIVINDLQSYNNCLDTSLINLNQPDSPFLDFTKRTLVGIDAPTDLGLEVYSKIFVCKNDDKKDIIIRCQYELSGQCAGSRIFSHAINSLISIPKVPDDYHFTFSVKNVNPY